MNVRCDYIFILTILCQNSFIKNFKEFREKYVLATFFGKRLSYWQTCSRGKIHRSGWLKNTVLRFLWFALSNADLKFESCRLTDGLVYVKSVYQMKS